MTDKNSSRKYPLEHENEFQRLEAQSLAEGYRCEQELLDLKIQAGQRILDVGCGSGAITRQLALRSPSAWFVGCDASELRIRQASETHPWQSNLIFFLEDLTQLTFDNESFDVVICRLVLHHLSREDRDQAVSEIFRCLKPGGRLVMVEPDALFHCLHPMPEVVRTTLARVEEDASIDLFVGRKLPSLLLAAGFVDCEWRVEPVVSKSVLMAQELTLMTQRLLHLMPFLERVLGSREEAERFRVAMLGALGDAKSVYYFLKVIASVRKPVGGKT